jgi:phosphohistidine swiveling domain-containing protein
MRTEGWVPFIRTIIKLDIALSTKLDMSPEASQLLNFLGEEEIKHFIDTGNMVTDAELIRRKGNKSEFLILHDHGKFKMYYGAEAGSTFKQLVPKVNHAKITEVHGATAVLGKITDKACVYKWGDDIAAKTEEIKRHPILIAGQTRPAMMSMIRLAKGIVTDEGGITSHAAIVSRELGIPSVIGTIHATSVFKSGDLVELDADNGVVRRAS